MKRDMDLIRKIMLRIEEEYISIVNEAIEILNNLKTDNQARNFLKNTSISWKNGFIDA